MGNTQSSNEEKTTLTVCCSRGRNKKRKGQGLMEKSDTNQGRGNGFEEVQPLVNCAENEGNVPDFPFENLVFEGGGNKCLAFVGCLKHLEKIGATKHIRRVGGTSGGATIAALVALGYTADEIETFLTEDVQGVFIDHSCGYLSLIPNLFRNYGWNPGTKIYEWLGDKIEKPTKTGKENHPDMTFLELYKKENGMELCVVVTNLNQMRIDYCHPKTTPNMKIRDALRMSMAIPGIFAAGHMEKHGVKDICVDGGMLCNYPVHCFDGWFLSMDPNDSFFNKVETPYAMMDRSSFMPFNKKTLGFLLYEEKEKEVIRPLLEARDGTPLPLKPKPETRLYRHKTSKRGKKSKRDTETDGKTDSSAGIITVRAVEAFFKAIKTFERQNPEYLNRNDLDKIFQDEKLSKFRKILFPDGEDEDLYNSRNNDKQKKKRAKTCFRSKDTDKGGKAKSSELKGNKKQVDTVDLFEAKDIDHDGQLSFCELMTHLQQHVFPKTGYLRAEVKGFTSYLGVLKNTAVKHVNSMYIGKEDANRTVGINTGYIGTKDYNLEKADREFIVERGRQATMAFFKNFEEKQGQHNLELNADAAGPAVIEAEVVASDMTDDTSDITEYDNEA